MLSPPLVPMLEALKDRRWKVKRRRKWRPGRPYKRDKGELEAWGSTALFHFLVLRELGRKQGWWGNCGTIVWQELLPGLDLTWSCRESLTSAGLQLLCKSHSQDTPKQTFPVGCPDSKSRWSSPRWLMMVNIYPTLTLCQVLDLSTFHVLTHLILTATQWGRYYYYPPITDEETEAQK